MKDVLCLDEGAAEYDRAFAHVSEHFLPFLLRTANLSPAMRVLERSHRHRFGRSGCASHSGSEWLCNRHGYFPRNGRTGAQAIVHWSVWLFEAAGFRRLQYLACRDPA
jgi:hypothetical protein